MTNYEVMFILNANLDEEAKNAAVERFQKVITDGAGVIGKVDVWGTRRLAYPIQKMNDGYYVVIEFQAGPELPKELDRRLRIADACIRHIIVNKDEK